MGSSAHELRSSVALVSIVLTTCTCGPGPPGDGGVDAGADAPDAPPDAGLDTPADSADVRGDAGPNDPEWITVGGFPPECELAYAGHPERVFEATWVPCEPASLASCTWLPPDDRYLAREFWSETTRFHDGARGFFAGAVSLGTPSDLRRAVFVAPADGSALFAVREWAVPQPDGSFCIAGAPGMTGAGVAVVGLHFVDAASIDRRLFHAPLSAATDLFELPRSLDATEIPDGNSGQQLVASESTQAFVVQPIGHVVIREGATSVVRGGPSGSIRGEPQALVLHGRDAFWMSWYEGPTGNEVWLIHASVAEPEEVLVRVADTKLWGLAVDDEHICWIVETARDASGRPDRGDLYCSPYATDASGISPSPVRVGVRPRPVGAVGDDLYAQVVQDRTTFAVTLEVFEIASGIHRRYALPPAWRHSDDAFWITTDEIAFPISVPFDSVVRVGLDAFELVP